MWARTTTSGPMTPQRARQLRPPLDASERQPPNQARKPKPNPAHAAGAAYASKQHCGCAASYTESRKARHKTGTRPEAGTRRPGRGPSYTSDRVAQRWTAGRRGVPAPTPHCALRKGCRASLRTSHTEIREPTTGDPPSTSPIPPSSGRIVTWKFSESSVLNPLRKTELDNNDRSRRGTSRLLAAAPAPAPPTTSARRPRRHTRRHQPPRRPPPPVPRQRGRT